MSEPLHVLIARLETAVARQRREIEKDNEYWEQLGTGQDSQEAEASGLMEGTLSAYEAVLRLVRGEEDGDLPTIEGNDPDEGYECEDCAVNGEDCRTHGEAFKLARRVILENPVTATAALRRIG